MFPETMEYNRTLLASSLAVVCKRGPFNLCTPQEIDTTHNQYNTLHSQTPLGRFFDSGKRVPLICGGQEQRPSAQSPVFTPTLNTYVPSTSCRMVCSALLLSPEYSHQELNTIRAVDSSSRSSSRLQRNTHTLYA